MNIKLLFCISFLFLMNSFSVYADNIVPLTSLTKSCKPLINKNLKIPKVPIVGTKERDHKKMSRALEKLGEEKYDEAIELFKAHFESSKTEHVKATLAKFIGIAYAQQNKTKEATVYFEQALDLGKGFLQHQELQDLTQNVASMHYSNDNYEGSLKFIRRWLKNSKVDNDQLYLLYSAILNDSGKLKESVCPAYWSAKLSKNPSKTPYSLLLQAHFEFKDFTGSIALLKQLILYFPTEKQFWRQLASLYNQEDKLDDALAVMEMFYVQGLMETENDYKQLSAMFAFSDIPYRTAVILKEGIDKGLVKPTEKNWSNIAANFHVANELEKSVAAHQESSKLSTTGEHDQKAGELLYDLQQYRKSVSSIDKAFQKGGLKDAGKAYVRKGLAQIALKQFSNAIKTFDKATKYKKWRKQAVQWQSYAKNLQANAVKLAKI